jgi:hypothetical protein
MYFKLGYNFLLILNLYSKVTALHLVTFILVTHIFHKLNIPLFFGFRFVDSGVDCADASSVSVVGRGVGFTGKESSDLKETRKVTDFDVSCPFTQHRQRLHGSPATVSKCMLY